ncbi:MAG: type II secretion system secretin GspD [Deltaproteobacteria bacterium]|nr:type II secretion system secretin GspD [Deltaproteobacteria bacterium]
MRKIAWPVLAFWLAAACSSAAAAASPPPESSKEAAPAAASPAADNQAAAPAGPGAGEKSPPGTQAGGPVRLPVFISMDFTDVDLPVLIKFISEQTKRNFIFDERVQGKITIISPRKITVDEAYDVFLSVLAVKGYTTVPQANAIKIVPLGEVRQESLPTGKVAAQPSAEYVTRLVPLQFLDVAEVLPLLTPLVSKGGLLNAFPASNTLLLIDSTANIDRFLKILGELDVAGTANVIRIFPLKNASVTEVVRTLDALYQETAAPPGRPRGVRPGKVRGAAPPKFLADTRTNSVIVLAGKDVMADVEDLLRKLDMPAPENTGKINVYYLENADAEEMTKVLSSLSEKRAGPVPPAAPPATIRGVISAELEGGVRITADKATNSLIIIASPNDYQTLVEVIRKLDIPRRQVYVEALIMEISLDKGLDLGVEFRGAGETRNNGAVIGGTNFDFKGNVNELFAALATGNPLLFSGTGLIAGGIAGKVTLPDGTQIPAITAILRAAQNRNNINILSSPHLLTTDNKEAEIVVGENVPFITSQTTNTTNIANITNTIERKDVGITLRLTPHIHESEFVNLDIFQESSAVKGDTLLNVNLVGPTTTKRSAKTSVLVRDGDTVVLGGMMQETYSTIRKQVPVLGDIPLLGYLFRFKSVTRSKTNLLIFLTPHIIKEPGDMARVTGAERERMDRFIRENKEEVQEFLHEKAGKEK